MSTTTGALSPGNECGPRKGVARASVFYGWAMLPQAMLAQILTTPGQTLGIAVFTSSLVQSLGVTQTQLTGAYGLGTFLASLPLAALGVLMDRHGIRRTMTLVVLLFGGACLFASQVQGLATLFLAFFLLRFLGQGALSLLAGNTMAMWFRRRLGTVTGLMNVGVILVMAQLPPLIRLLINHLGWRGTYAAMGVLVWLLMLPVLAMFFRDRPEDLGLRVDGDEDRSPESALDSPLLHASFDLKQALATRSFRVMTAVFVAWALVGTGLVFNASSLFASMGLSETSADYALSAFFTAMAVSQLVGGLLADRVALHLLIAAAVCGMSVAVALLSSGSPSSAHLAYVVYGGCQGLLGSAASTLWVRYYGRDHVGKIRGLAQTAAVAGSSIGPVAMSWSAHWSGSYQISLWTFSALLAALSVASLAATKPRQVARPS